MIYISHLDLIRLFLRVLRMCDMRPVYSNGFNPHPKMSLALPLPLGVVSICELLEFETAAAIEKDANSRILALLNERLPEGIRVTGFAKKPPEQTKSLAALIEYASYEILCERIDAFPDKLKDFLSRDEVLVPKRGAGDGKANSKADDKANSSLRDIRGMIHEISVVHDIKGRMLCTATLASGKGGILNPLTFFRAFVSLYEPESEIGNFTPVITRTALLGAGGNPL